MNNHERHRMMVASQPSCAAKVVRYVVVPLAIVAVAANMRDVVRYLKLLAM